MTNLNAVNVGMNKYCGPAVLSILTGKSTDECARVIGRINGQYNVVGVLLTDLLKAADKMGFDNTFVDTASSFYGTLVRLAVRGDGTYIVTVPNHFVVIEVKDRKVYFCDNHTKEPMPAASSARLLQKVVSVYQVIKRPETIIPPAPLRSEPVLVESPKIYTYKEAIKDISMTLDRYYSEDDTRIKIRVIISNINEDKI